MLERRQGMLLRPLHPSLLPPRSLLGRRMREPMRLSIGWRGAMTRVRMLQRLRVGNRQGTIHPKGIPSRGDRA